MGPILISLIHANYLNYISYKICLFFREKQCFFLDLNFRINLLRCYRSKYSIILIILIFNQALLSLRYSAPPKKNLSTIEIKIMIY
jgi:hypothetical protein